MKKILLFIAMMLPMISLAQDNDDAPEENLTIKKKPTSYETFISDYGSFLKRKDYNTIPKIKVKKGNVDKTNLLQSISCKLKIREFIRDNESTYFAYITCKYFGDWYSAFISYNDLLELDKALTELEKQFKNDSLGECDLVVNQFCTEDYLELGYRLNKTSKRFPDPVSWYINFDTSERGAILTFDSPEDIRTVFTNALNKINELKAKK